MQHAALQTPDEAPAVAASGTGEVSPLRRYGMLTDPRIKVAQNAIVWAENGSMVTECGV